MARSEYGWGTHTIPTQRNRQKDQRPSAIAYVRLFDEHSDADIFYSEQGRDQRKWGQRVHFSRSIEAGHPMYLLIFLNRRGKKCHNGRVPLINLASILAKHHSRAPYKKEKSTTGVLVEKVFVCFITFLVVAKEDARNDILYAEETPPNMSFSSGAFSRREQVSF